MPATITQIPLPYFEDSSLLFETCADQPWAFFLDSGYPVSRQGRYDVLCYAPDCTLQTYGTNTIISDAEGERSSSDDPFALVKQALGPARPTIGDLPFSGGALGYFAYDLVRRIERLPNTAATAEQMPDMAIGIYRWAVVVDHHQSQSWLVGHELEADLVERLLNQFGKLSKRTEQQGFSVLSAPVSNMSREQYGAAFQRIKQYLKEGDCYQINLTQRFSSPCRGYPWVAYQALRRINAAPFSAYLNLPDGQVLSSSPERFLRVHANTVETKPIKGTRPRRDSEEHDRLQILALAESPKDRAENVMIVDLLRNDLGRCCRPGSVKVPTLFDVETYATVHHLVSTVTGELAAGRHALDLLRACFPGGSITGAPKIRAMQVIEELEPHRRGVYCGAIGYIGFDGNMDTNIAIRTLVHNHDTIRFWVGGGIVNDSDEAAEYQECFDKAAALLDVLRRFQTC